MPPLYWKDRVAFDEAKPAKADLWRGDRLFAGLNCFLAGQAQPLHAHAGADKFYLVLRGNGAFEVGGESFAAGPGALVPAAAEVAHAVRNDGAEPLVVLTVIAPPPGRR